MEGICMLKGFKEFVMRGNVIDLAVAVVLGAAFGQIVTAIVEHLINPLVAAVFGKPDISQALAFTLNGAQFSIGAILQAALNFLFIAIAVYFLIVLPLNKLAERRRRGKEPEPAPLTADQQLLTEIRDLLRVRQ